MSETIEHGAEIHFTTDREPAPADKVDLLAGGWVKLTFRRQYAVEIHPPHKIDTIHTHTTDEEEAEWLGDDDE